MYIATSHPSLRDKVLAALVEHTTLFIFDEFQYSGQVRFCKSVKKIISPARLPALGKLLKLASVSSWSFTVFKSNLGNWIKLCELLTFLIILLT